MDITKEIFCRACHAPVLPSAYFCSQCGKKLKEPPLSTSAAKQILVYFVSFFLTPFGLGYAFKYLKQPGLKARIIGVVAILLTILAIVLMILIVKTFYGFVYGSVNTLDF